MSGSSKPRVLVIGGGPAGWFLAHNLQDAADVTLVDRKDYLELSFAVLRVLVEPGFADKVIMPFTSLKSAGNFVKGTVVRLSKEDAELADGQRIAFDYAAICTGSAYSGIIGYADSVTASERIAALKRENERIQNAKDVLIIGGGPVGLELAGEIATDFPNKHVTLVHSQATLLPDLKASVGKNTERNLKELNVQLILSDKVMKDSGADGQYKTEKGKSITADLVYWCVGAKPNTDFLRQDLSSCLDASGRVQVDDSFRVLSQGNLFALGDASNIAENKLAFFARKHGELTAKNIKKLIKAGKDSAPSLDKWKPNMGMKMLLVSLGRNRGTGQVMCCGCDGCFVRSMKSQGMPKLVEDQWRKDMLK